MTAPTTRRSIGAFLAAPVLAMALATTLAACANPGDPGEKDTATPTSASVDADAPRLVDIGGRSLQLRCTGTGSPTVILEAGLGGDLHSWDRVQPALAERTRVCSYDRPGTGGSEPASGTRTTGQAVEDLHALLEAADVPSPYVLVGFSFGGLITQHYASTFPDEVSGLVLVESLHPREFAVTEKHLTRRQIEEDHAAALGNTEGMDPFASVDEIASAGPLPAVPLVVVSAGILEPWPPGWDSKLFDRLRDELQQDLARSVPDGRRVIAEHSRHEVPREQPDVIVEAVNSVLDAQS
jgi:pimeloyl-ACP methyl ester carboxylesterase